MMPAVNASAEPPTEAVSGLVVSKVELPLEEIEGHKTFLDIDNPGAGAPYKDVQLPQESLMEIIFNLEQEREQYLEAVALLHEQLLESQEQQRQLSDSHMQIARKLEEEVNEGWKEAEAWQAKYQSIEKAIREKGIDINRLNDIKAKDGNEPSYIPAAPLRVSSFNSDACTVVTKGDLINKTAAPNGEGMVGEWKLIGQTPRSSLRIVPRQQSQAICRRDNAMLPFGANIHGDSDVNIFMDNSMGHAVRDWPTFRQVGTPKRGFSCGFNDLSLQCSIPVATPQFRHSACPSRPLERQSFPNMRKQRDDLSKEQKYSCARCMHMEVKSPAISAAVGSFYLDEPPCIFDDWIYVQSPYKLDQGFHASGELEGHDNTKRVIDILVDAMT